MTRARGWRPSTASTSWPPSSAAGPGGSAPTTTPAKVAALVALGGTAETLEPVVWEQRETYAEALAAVEGRIHSFTWRLPDQVFHTAVGRLRAELEAAHPDLDTPQLAGHSFTLTAVRF